MLEKDKAPIPTPFKRRWQVSVQRYGPVLAFAGAVFGVTALWREHILPREIKPEAPGISHTEKTNPSPASVPQSGAVTVTTSFADALKLPDPSTYLKSNLDCKIMTRSQGR